MYDCYSHHLIHFECYFWYKPSWGQRLGRNLAWCLSNRNMGSWNALENLFHEGLLLIYYSYSIEKPGTKAEQNKSHLFLAWIIEIVAHSVLWMPCKFATGCTYVCWPGVQSLAWQPDYQTCQFINVYSTLSNDFKFK